MDSQRDEGLHAGLSVQHIAPTRLRDDRCEELD